jgi:hypothetical protein
MFAQHLLRRPSGIGERLGGVQQPGQRVHLHRQDRVVALSLQPRRRDAGGQSRPIGILQGGEAAGERGQGLPPGFDPPDGGGFQRGQRHQDAVIGQLVQ